MLQGYAIETLLKAILIDQYGIFDDGKFNLKRVG
jgi:hypothetical protein